MPAIRYKWGGTWQGASWSGSWSGNVANGNVRAKWAGYGSMFGENGWFIPTTIKAKVGPVGGGTWTDTGYVGRPNPPGSISVNSWSFTEVTTAWSAPSSSGGAPVTAYQFVQTDGNGAWTFSTEVSPETRSYTRPVGEDYRVQFYVRSKSGVGPGVVGGLYSDFVGPLRVQIGHSAQGYWGSENRTRSWASGHVSGARNDAEPFQVYVPSNVVIQGMHWRNLQSPIADYMYGIVTPVADRTVNWIYAGNLGGPINNELGTVFSHNNTDRGFYNGGENNYWGIIPLGAGWSRTGDWYFMLWVDDLWCDGYETYQVSVWVVTRNHQENTYW